MNLKKRVMNKKVIVGTSAAGATAVAGFTVGPGAVNSLMGGDFSALTAIKWSSIVVVIGGALFFMIRNGVLKYEIIETGERGFRMRWGTVRRHRKTGKYKVLYPGRKHFFLRGIYDVAVISIRDRVTRPNREKLDYVYRQKNIEFAPLIFWRVVDTEDDLYKSIFTVYQLNRAEEKRETLEEYVVSRVIGSLGRHLGEFQSDENGLPVVTLDGKRGHVPTGLLEEIDTIREMIGVEVFRIELESLTIAAEERHKEGLLGLRLGEFA